MAPRRQKTGTISIEPGETRSGRRADGADLIRRLHDLVSEHPDFEVLHGPHSHVYSFRYVPNGLAERQEEPEVRTLLDRLNSEIVEAVRRGGLALVGPTRGGGRAAVSVSICSRQTTGDDVEAAFEAVARWGRLLTKAHPLCLSKPEATEAL